MSDKERYALYLCSREWGLLREQVRERCGGYCERCEVNCMSHVHHLTYIRKYNELPEDLQGLCEECHLFVHGFSDKDPKTLLMKETSEAFYRSLLAENTAALLVSLVNRLTGLEVRFTYYHNTGEWMLKDMDEDSDFTYWLENVEPSLQEEMVSGHIGVAVETFLDMHKRYKTWIESCVEINARKRSCLIRSTSRKH